MKMPAVTLILLTINVSVFGFNHGNKTPNTASTCRDGSMTLAGSPDPIHHLYVEGATSKDFVLDKDTLSLPYCYGFAGRLSMPDSAHTFIKDSISGGLRVNYKIIHLTDTVPFFLRKELTIVLKMSAKQQQHFDMFKRKILQRIKDTALGPNLWFELSSVEASIKNNDVISYVLGIRHLSELWRKVSAAE